MTTNERTVSFLLELARLCRLETHEQGRITLNVGLTNVPRVYSLLREMNEAGMELEGIPGYISHETSAGLSGGSVTIEYDPEILPADLWDDLCKVNGQPDLEEMVTARLHSLLAQHLT